MNVCIMDFELLTTTSHTIQAEAILVSLTRNGIVGLMLNILLLIVIISLILLLIVGMISGTLIG